MEIRIPLDSKQLDTKWWTLYKIEVDKNYTYLQLTDHIFLSDYPILSVSSEISLVKYDFPERIPQKIKSWVEHILIG